MKTILIEAVSNGWIVRPFSPCENWMAVDKPEIHVFTSIEALTAQLPKLLDAFHKENEVDYLHRLGVKQQS